MHNNSIIELSRAALQQNLEFLRATFGKKIIFSSVVKGNAYGHGISEFVTLAHECGISHFSAFDAEEARIIKQCVGSNATIMIMGFVADEDLEWAIENDIQFFVFEKTRLQKAVKSAKKLGHKARLHIEVETGMNRTGFNENELRWVTQILQNEKEHLIFSGLCTHYAGAESVANYYRVKSQIQAYEKAYNFFKDSGLVPQLRHTACSASSMMFPETRMDLVRIGIMQYGLWPSPEVFVNYMNAKRIKSDPLKRVILWKSQVMSVKKVNAGDFVGYGTSYMAGSKMEIAVIPIGYSHGYSRSLSNHGHVLINGQRCLVVGTVNMNMITVDVTAAGNVRKGDEVVLIGNQQEAAISIASFSDFSNQLNYELLTRIARTIPRNII
ncbi:MAG: alanine racemase [Flavobacterium sp.]|nr:alanine racemase [Flavobacterium sp.]